MGAPPEPLYDLTMEDWYAPTDYPYAHSMAWTYYWEMAIRRVLERGKKERK